MKAGRIIDFHTHIQPDAVVSDRKPFLDGEPDFRILYSDPASRLATTADLVSMMDAEGIGSAVALGFAWQDMSRTRLHNDTVLKAVSDYPGRIYGFCCVNPFDPDAAGEIRRCYDAGASGVGEVGLYARDLDAEYIDAMAPIMKLSLERNRPVMMHVNEPIGHDYSGKAPCTIKGIYNFVSAYPENRIVLAHWGGGLFFFNTLKKEAGERLRNVWFDSAASPYLYNPSIWKVAAEIIGPERMLFGTDYPLLGPRRFFRELEESGLGPEDLEAVLHGNAERLLRGD